MIKMNLKKKGDSMETDKIIFCKNSDFVFRKIAEEYILIPIRHRTGDLDKIYNFNELGARFWELIDGSRTMEEIILKLLEEYEVSRDVLQNDLEIFITKLDKIGCVKKVIRSDNKDD
jgi:hypothetical protein